MPFYRMKGIGPVHISVSKLPKPCAAKFGIGDQQQYCMEMSGFICDGPVGGGRTCDRALCDAHAFEVGKNRHYCPECRADHIDNTAQPGLFTHLVRS